MYGIIITLAIYVTFTALWQAISDVPQYIRVWFTYGMCLLLAPLMLLPVGTGALRARPLDPKDPLAPQGENDEEGVSPGRSHNHLNVPLLTPLKPPEDRQGPPACLASAGG